MMVGKGNGLRATIDKEDNIATDVSLGEGGGTALGGRRRWHGWASSTNGHRWASGEWGDGWRSKAAHSLTHPTADHLRRTRGDEGGDG